MNENHLNNLDESLKRWASAQELSAEQADSLAGRILSEAIARQGDDNKLALPSDQSPRDTLPWFVGSLTLAASVLCLVALRWNGQTPPVGSIANRSVSEGGAGSSAPSAAANFDFNSESVQSQALNRKCDGRGRLFAHINEDFDSKLSWLAETQDEVKFELNDQAIDNQEPLICVRLRYLAVVGSAPKSIDLVVRNQQLVQLGPQGEDSQLLVWPFVTSDGKVLVESEIRDRQGIALANQTILVTPQGQPDLTSKRDAPHIEVESIRLLKLPSI